MQDKFTIWAMEQVDQGATLTILAANDSGIAVERSAYSTTTESGRTFNFPAAVFTFPVTARDSLKA